METQEIERILKEALNLDEAYVQAEDAHYGVIPVSHISSNEIHALSIRTYTVEKWKRERLLNHPA